MVLLLAPCAFVLAMPSKALSPILLLNPAPVTYCPRDVSLTWASSIYRANHSELLPSATKVMLSIVPEPVASVTVGSPDP